jgi:hypothetical protein
MRAAEKHSDEAWAIAYPIIEKEAKQANLLFPGPHDLMNCHRQKYRHFLVQKVVVNSVSVEEAGE